VTEAAIFSYCVADCDATYTANFTTAVLLTMSAGVGGTVIPSSNGSTAVRVCRSVLLPTAAGSPGGPAGGTGSFLPESTNPASVTVNGPITESASSRIAGDDTDGDGIPDVVEFSEGHQSLVKTMTSSTIGFVLLLCSSYRDFLGREETREG